jgi:ribonucleoside-diphosphate reductase alpha chain
LGINRASRTNVIKPAGTTSLIFGTASGIHNWHSEYYYRRFRINKVEPIYNYLMNFVPNLIEDDRENPKTTAVVTIPQKAPKGSNVGTEDPINMLERIKYFHTNWIKPGHISGDNTNNVSATVYAKTDSDWENIGEWLYDNRNSYNGISVFPYHGGKYPQAPFEECTKEQYNKLIGYLKSIDLSMIREDGTYVTNKVADAVACAGNSCEVSY